MTVINLSGSVRPSDYTLDIFIAPELSKLTECNAPDLSDLTDQWLDNFILNNIQLNLPDKEKAYLLIFFRRVEAAFYEYNKARNALTEYITTDRNIISPYFQALNHFETLFAQLYQAYLLLKSATELKLFKKNDNSELDRVNKIYNTSKHMYERIEKGKLPEKGTCAIWITNNGIESTDAAITFVELKDILIELSKLANKISNLTP